MDKVIDYAEEFHNAIYAQGKGRQFLALYENVDNTQRVDGKVAEYWVLQRGLSCDCERPNDQAWACVTDSEITYWDKDEFDLAYLEEGRGSLFDCFCIIS